MPNIITDDMTHSARGEAIIAGLPERCRRILGCIDRSYAEILGDKLVGIYVHGSIAFGCFNPARSDIDFLVVTSEAPSLDEKTAMIEKLLELDAEAPQKGLEMSAVLEKYCRDFVYPTPFELHFSNMHKERCRRDVRAYCETMNGVDPDLAAHFAVTRQVGIALSGRPAREVFAEVPRGDYLKSVMADVREAAEDAPANPIYAVLNLCRTLAFVRDGEVRSKLGGGEWGAENLPPEYAAVAAEAADCYASEREFALGTELTADFCRFMLGELGGIE